MNNFYDMYLLAGDPEHVFSEAEQTFNFVEDLEALAPLATGWTVKWFEDLRNLAPVNPGEVGECHL